jgi:hypothetical protein
MTRAARLAPALAGLAVLTLAAAPAQRPQSIPLEDSHLFIAPSGEPFRSASGQPYPVVQWFKRADSNGDGKLDRAEFKADTESFFRVLDRNGDGVVTDPEIAYYEKVTVPELNDSASGIDNNPSDDRTKLSKDLQGAAPYGLINDPEPVRSADDSLIGRLTLKSYLKRADHNFAVLDQDGRGYLLLEELPRTQVQTAATPVRPRK